VKLAVLALCAGCLPPDASTTPPPPAVDPIAHTWNVVDHVLTGKAAISDADAREMHGRVVTITAAGYTSPWQGTCEDASRVSSQRALLDVTLVLDLDTKGRGAARLALADTVVEWRLACGDVRSPPITLWVAGDRAMTCSNGVCYLLAVAR
jgi:hypothetical protein